MSVIGLNGVYEYIRPHHGYIKRSEAIFQKVIPTCTSRRMFDSLLLDFEKELENTDIIIWY